MASRENILLLDLLKVLYEQTDFNENYHMTQKEVIEVLEGFYGYEDLYKKRKTVKDNMEKLIDYFRKDYQYKGRIAYNATFRNTKNKETEKTKESAVLSDFSYRHLFTHSELRLIIDGILFSNQIPLNRRKKLIVKLEGLASKHFRSHVSHIRTLSNDCLMNDELFTNIEKLDRAMNESKQVSFYYNHYTVDEQSRLILQPRKNRQGVDRQYIINPYQMIATNGRYYLLCNNDYFDNISHYRLDRITNIEVRDTSRKRMSEVRGLENGLDLSQHMAEHIYMFTGESVTVRLRFNKQVIGEFVDWFGFDQITYSDQTADEVTATVKVNEIAMRKWALQYALHVRVLSPKSLVDDIKKDIEQALKNYK